MKRSIIAAAVFSSFFMSAGVFAADVDTGTLTIKGNIAESPCKFEAGGDSVSINMPTVPTTVFEGKAKYSTYDDAVGVTSSMLKISCPKEVAGVKLSLITNDKITGNDKAIASSNDTVGYYLYLGDNSDVLDVSAPFNIESYKTAEGQYAIPFKAKYLKLNSSYLNYVIDCMKNTTTKIANIKAYMVTTLYNAPNTINHYYQQEVQHDMYGGGWHEKGIV